MSIFEKFFNKIFAKDGKVPSRKPESEVGDESYQREPKDTNVSTDPAKAAEQKEEKRNSLKLKGILDIPEVVDIISNLYAYYQKGISSPKEFLAECKSSVDAIVNILKNTQNGKKFIEGNYDTDSDFSRELITYIIRTFKSTSDAAQLSNELKKIFAMQDNDLYRVLEFLDLYVKLSQAYPGLVNAFTQSYITDDVTGFFKECVPIVQMYRKFKVTPFTEISDKDKDNFLKKVNLFYTGYLDEDVWLTLRQQYNNLPLFRDQHLSIIPTW